MDNLLVCSFRSAGRYNAPVTIRSPFGGGVATPEMHADSLEGLMAAQPGLTVVIPSTPYDAKGLLISAIRDENPVIFLEHMKFIVHSDKKFLKKSIQFHLVKRM